MPDSTSLANKLGVDTWVLEAFPIEKAVRILQEEGFACFEYAYEHFQHDDLKGTMKSRIRNLYDQVSTLSIEASQMHAPYGELDGQLASTDEVAQSKGIEKAKEWLEYANTLGVKALVFHPALDRSCAELSLEDEARHLRARNREVFTEIGEFAGEVGVKVALENRDERVFGSRPHDLLEVVQANPDHLGVCLDTGHANMNGFDCGQFVTEIGDHLIATHIHDNDGRSDQHLLPFIGNIDWNNFFSAIECVSYSGSLIIEVPGSSSDEHLCLNKTKLIKRMLKIL